MSGFTRSGHICAFNAFYLTVFIAGFSAKTRLLRGRTTTRPRGLRRCRSISTDYYPSQRGASVRPGHVRRTRRGVQAFSRSVLVAAETRAKTRGRPGFNVSRTMNDREPKAITDQPVIGKRSAAAIREN